MSEKLDVTTSREQESQLAMAIANSLDKSLDSVDDISAQRLKLARAKALSQKPQSSRKWLALSVAASLAVLLVIPSVWHQHNMDVDDELETLSQELLPDAQELDDVDMLMAMEADDA